MPAPVADLVGSPALYKYIKSLCTVLLDARDEDVDASLAQDSGAHAHLAQFISNPLEPVLYIQKVPSADPEDATGTFPTLWSTELLSFCGSFDRLSLLFRAV